jgi:ABC-type polysaccharide/polyol phosphate transport system ATPase subunit
VAERAQGVPAPHQAIRTRSRSACCTPCAIAAGDHLDALRGRELHRRAGEFFGIVGPQRLGQVDAAQVPGRASTRPTRAHRTCRALSTFIELGVGFNPDLAARDNVMLNAIDARASPREARARFDACIDFAELHDFVDLKLKNYSSGMLVRLAFSVMIQVDAEILLIDEVLAVGDAGPRPAE